MTSTVKVNNVQASDGGNIINQCGTNITIGASGDTIALASGASQTGFGRTGTVDWQTGSIKTTTFTAANGEGYFANTSGGAFVMNLPAGTAGNIVSVVDYTNTFQTNALTITPNGSQKIGGTNASFVASTEGQSLTFVYVDDTEGWKNVQDSTTNATGVAFLTATGGTITCSGDYKIHTFTGPGTFQVTNLSPTPANNALEYLVVAGGGAGGGTAPFGGTNGGGGGAGGVRFYASPSTNPQTGPAAPRNGPAAITATISSFPIVVGAGGAASSTVGNNGSDSSGLGITSTAGGGGGSSSSPLSPSELGRPGGSAGGGADGAGGGTGNTPPVSPAQGSDGGPSGPSAENTPAGGGFMAAGTQGSPGSPGVGGAGGGLTGFGTSGVPSSGQFYFGGGGGGASGGTVPASPGQAGAGGLGGGAGGGSSGPTNLAAGTGANATANTGGGGGAGTLIDSSTGGSGGSGIVVIRYKFQ